MINGKLSWTAGRRADTSGRRQRGPRARAAAECRPGRGWASPAHASVLAIVAVNRDPLSLAELTEIEGLDSTMLSRVVGRLDSPVWSGGGSIRTITALPGSRSPPTGKRSSSASRQSDPRSSPNAWLAFPSRAGGCPGHHAARAGKPLRGPAGAPERPVSRVTRSRTATMIVVNCHLADALATGAMLQGSGARAGLRLRLRRPPMQLA